MTVTSILVIILIVFIAFSIWNAINLRSIKNRPLRKDELNDKHYWELKYQMQFMTTISAVVVGILTFLGYNSLREVKDSIRTEMAASVDSSRRVMAATLDSSRREMEILEARQHIVDTKLTSSDSVVYRAELAIRGLTDRESILKNAISMRSGDLEKLKDRIQEINSKNIIQQNIYIVDDLTWAVPTGVGADTTLFRRFYFKDLISNTGQKLPKFSKPPFVLPIASEGSLWTTQNVTSESFEINALMTTNPSEKIKFTVFITEKP